MKWDWLTSTAAPWWAVLGAPLVAAVLTFVLTRRAAGSDAKRADAAADRVRWMDRKVAVYADYAAAQQSLQTAWMNNKMDEVLVVHATALGFLQTIELIGPKSVVDAAAEALSVFLTRQREPKVWYEKLVAFREAARADLAR